MNALVSLLLWAFVFRLASSQGLAIPKPGHRSPVQFRQNRLNSQSGSPLVRTPVNRILPSPSPGTKRLYAVEKNPVTGKYELVITDRSLKPFENRRPDDLSIVNNGGQGVNGKGTINSVPDGREINILDPSTGRVLGRLSYEGNANGQNNGGTNTAIQGNRNPLVNIKVVDEYNVTADPPALSNPGQMFAQEFVQDNKHNTRVRIDPSNNLMQQSSSHLQPTIPSNNGQTIPGLKSSLPINDILAQMETSQKTGNTNNRNNILNNLHNSVNSATNQNILLPISQVQSRPSSFNNNRRAPSNSVNMRDIVSWVNKNAGAIKRAVGIGSTTFNNRFQRNNRGMGNSWRPRSSANFIRGRGRNAVGMNSGRSGFQSIGNSFSRSNNMQKFGVRNSRGFSRPSFSRNQPTAHQQAILRPSVQLKGFSFVRITCVISNHLRWISKKTALNYTPNHHLPCLSTVDLIDSITLTVLLYFI